MIKFNELLASAHLYNLLLFHINSSLLKVVAPLNLTVELKLELPPLTLRTSTTALAPIRNLLHLTALELFIFKNSCCDVSLVL